MVATDTQEVLQISANIDDQDRLFVWLSGEIDAHNARSVTRLVLADRPEPRDVVIDLGNVSFIDSSGLQALVECHGQLECRAIGCTIRNVSRPVRRIFEITGLDHLLSVS
jgi:anti-anti-sigma factor